MTLLEVLAALVITGIALLMGIAVVAWTDRVEHRAERRAVAVELASSVAERVRAAPYDSIAPGELDLSAEYVDLLPEPTVELTVKEDEELRLKRVGIVVRWKADPPGELRLETAVGGAQIYR